MHRVLDYPQDALGHKQSTAKFRTGDIRWELFAREIVKVIPYPPPINFRYILKDLPHVSFPAWQLMKSKSTVELRKIKGIINRRRVGGKLQYLVWWKDRLKKDSTWEPLETLQKYAPEDIDKYDRKHPVQQPKKKSKTVPDLEIIKPIRIPVSRRRFDKSYVVLVKGQEAVMKRDELMKEYPTELQQYEADNKVNWSDVEELK